MDSRINHSDIENKWQTKWNDAKVFHSTPDTRPKISITMAPPNITGALTIAHALNGTFNDIIIRTKKLQGFNTVLVPGTDHAGIATQNRVDKYLREQGVDKNKLSKEEFLSKIHEWSDKYGKTIVNQQKKMGFACDWQRERFTMDAEYSKFVRKIFVKMFNDKLICKDLYIVNWCPVLKTAISDDEVNTSDVIGKMYYIKYAIKDQPDKFLIIATSRPETIFGDAAVAYNPDDERFNKMEGVQLLVPIINKEIKLIADHHAKKDIGSGLVKITPAHDKNDYDVGNRHDLPRPVIIDVSGKICNTGTKYDGIDRDIARKIIIKELTSLGLIEKIEDYKTTVKKCYRSDAVIEPMLTKQWFVKMKPLALIAKDMVIKKELEIIPNRHEKVFHNWVDNIRDWCISRQLIWGHQIPVWYCDDCDNMTCTEIDPDCCGKCESKNIVRDPDVLDTWFSSSLWAFAVFNDEERNYYFPTSILVTGEDILFFWIIRMMMMSGYIYGKIPFQKVYLHGIVRTHDENKKVVKMSKSLGNAVDPLDVAKKYGIDAMRFTLAMTMPKDSDMLLTIKSFDIGKTFCTKYWNVVRFCTSKLRAVCTEKIDEKKLDTVDIEMLNSLKLLTKNVFNNIDNFIFCDAAKELYSFVWNTVANEYLENAKLNMTDEKQKVLFNILCTVTKLLHPFIPHITEEVWSILSNQYHHSSVMLCEIDDFHL